MKCDDRRQSSELFLSAATHEEKRSKKKKIWNNLDAFQKPEKKNEKNHQQIILRVQSSKLAISSHRETFVNQSFWWFNDVIKFLNPSEAVDKRLQGLICKLRHAFFSLPPPTNCHKFSDLLIPRAWHNLEMSPT